ncbi:twin-arginine translocation protein, TatB subunit [Thioalkalivibrio sulfidiphilus HL-EbGr7]|uniref:Sec-independent protein translocase protein TatB n=1 Tax=Thioalkalivibrio sulfidiphilus (strain HL-EbGR7) TaxID=396588 RepID=B8GU36_THISH|nr:Sec-independent protein translocase protein TatB [Thioalkalivibrio sulfidiphilus]ACL71319.1 twin-arginine translocation protein, TatB subunit [Thioalkalivibrio sulfidiphilus HL-EbGr7]
MFDVGFWEILVILVVALLVVGPDRLPGLAREVGLWVRKIRGFVTNVRADIEQEFQTDELRKLLNEQNKEISQLKDMMKETEDSLRHEVEETSYLVKSIENEVKDVQEGFAEEGDFGEQATRLVKQRKAEADTGKVSDAQPAEQDTPPAKDRDEPKA